MTMEQQELFHEAADWRLLSLLFECPRAGWAEQVVALATTASTANLRDAAAASGEASEGLYHSIFGPGGPAAPREASYYDNVQLGYLLSELAAFYDAFGYHPNSPEVPDHVAVEAGFVGYLVLKQAYALTSSDTEHAAIAAEARQRFLTEHISSIAAPLAKVLEQSGVRYLALAASTLFERTGPPLQRPAPQPVPNDFVAEDSLFDCAV